MNNCSKDSNEKLVQWGKQNNILNYSTKFPVSIDINQNTISTNLIKITFNEKNEFTAFYDNNEIKGKDLCSLFLALSAKKNFRKTSLYSVFIKKAYATSLVSESTFFDELVVSIGSTSVVQSLIKNDKGEDRSFLGFRLARYFENKSKSLKSKEAFESILNSSFKINCNEKYITIEDSKERITVYKKAPKYEMNIFNFEKKQVVVDNKNSYFAEKSREFLITFSKNCNATKDSEKAISAYKEEKQAALNHMATYVGGHPVNVIKNMSRI